MSKNSNTMRNYPEEPLDNPLYLFYSHSQFIVNNVKELLMGRVLTIIDSAIADKTQNKATKDLIKQAIWGEEHLSNEFQDLIAQFVNKYLPEMKKHLKDLNIDERQGAKTFF